MVEWEEVILKIQKGDIITSKKGILLTDNMDESKNNCFKIKYLGNKIFNVKGNFERIIINRVRKL